MREGGFFSEVVVGRDADVFEGQFDKFAVDVGISDEKGWRLGADVRNRSLAFARVPRIMRVWRECPSWLFPMRKPRPRKAQRLSSMEAGCEGFPLGDAAADGHDDSVTNLSKTRRQFQKPCRHERRARET